MKRYIKFIILILLIITAIISIFFASPKIKEANIKTAIDKANYCEIDSDCVDAGGKCPFDCWVYVNKNEVDKISTLIDSFDSRCVYNCLSCPSAICTDNKCQAVCPY